MASILIPNFIEEAEEREVHGMIDTKFTSLMKQILENAADLYVSIYIYIYIYIYIHIHIHTHTHTPRHIYYQ